MSSDYRKKSHVLAPLSSPNQLKERVPADAAHHDFVALSRETINKILKGEDNRLLLIAGPCSIHNVAAAKEYAHRLKKLADETADHFFVVMRVYFEKPRTAVGWKGLLNDPRLDGSHDIEEGLHLTRQLLVELAEIGMPAAVEFLDPLTSHYFADLVSWGCVGARTTESQPHREMASGLPMPIAFKNSTGGNPQIAVNAIITSKHPHCFVSIDGDGKVAVVKTEGNPDAHLVLRGGEESSNYDPESIERALLLLREAMVPERVVVDCSHDNSRRCHENQPFVFQSVINQYIEGNKNIRGILLESNIEAGKQEHPVEGSEASPYISLTDACLGWEATEYLVHWAAQQFINDKSIKKELCSR